MSLLASASPWQENTKNRTPSMIKPDHPIVSGMTQEEYIPSDQKTTRVTELLTQMNQLSSDASSSSMSDFVPMSQPPPTRQALNGTLAQPVPPQTATVSLPRYGPDDSRLAALSNYKKIYTPQMSSWAPKAGGAAPYAPIEDDALMKKINYLIHLVEEQQYERTANITEEFILYLFFGVFVIYTLDSFTRVGKYTR